jgi:murein DD-endopeptidase MepM/ murein hydrolase activator NlpD
VIRIQRKGPGGLEMLVQHAGFVAIYSHFGMVAPAFAEGKRTVEAGEKLGVVGRTGLNTGAHLFFEMILDGKPTDPEPYLGLPACNGEALHTAAATPPVPAKSDDGGTVVGGRKYFQVFLQARQN